MEHTDVLAELDLTSAVESELQATTRLLPLRADQQALAERMSDVERYVRSGLRKDPAGQLTSILFASKQRGARPLNVWRLQDRVLYRALTQRLSASLPEQVRLRPSHAEFASLPLSNPDSRFINVTDISSFYVYVDHDILADELIAQTGDYSAVMALTDLLGNVMGGRVGIPQVHDSSDVLGDTYIDPIRRTLIRAGYDTYTYSDDFRIGAENLGQARSALELCASAAMRLGLVLNESKTFTFGRETYQETLGAWSEAEQRILEEEQLVDEAEVLGPYSDNGSVAPLNLHDLDLVEGGFDEDDAEGEVREDDERQGLVGRVWSIWANPKSENHRAPVVRQLLAKALPNLGEVDHTGPLGEIGELLRMAPDLTPAVANYLLALSEHGPGRRRSIRNQLHEIASADTLSEWQQVWIAHVAGRIRRTRTAPPYVEWLEDCVRTEEGSLAAHAAEALGRLRYGDPRLLADTLDRVGEEHRPPIVWALGRLDAKLALSVANSAMDRLLLPEDV